MTNIEKWNATLREAAAQHPDFLLLGDLLPIVNAERSKRNLRPFSYIHLCKSLQYYKCHSEVIHKGKNGMKFRGWHKAHAIDICLSMKQTAPHEKTENIWAVLPEKYRNDPNWMTFQDAAKKLGCPIGRLNELSKESGNQRIFLHPTTKRKMCYLPEMGEAVNWRDVKFIRSHCSPEEASRIFSTAKKETRRTPCSRRVFYYTPELVML